MALPYFGMTSAQETAASLQPEVDSSIGFNSSNSETNIHERDKNTGVTSSNATVGTFHAPETVDAAQNQLSTLPPGGMIRADQLSGGGKIIEYQMSRSVWWVPSQHLRYLDRDGKITLQQLWYDSNSTFTSKIDKEWRDIPIVVEGSPEDKLP